MSKQGTPQKRGILHPGIGLSALIAVQVAFVGVALWPLIWTEDEFLRHEEVRLVQDASGYLPRWLIELEDGELLKMPPPDGVAFQADSTLCVTLVRGHYGNLKARLADRATACATPADTSPSG